MLRNIAIGALTAAMLGCLPAHAQEAQELEGAPGYRSAEQDAARKAEAQKKAAQQAEQKQAQTVANKTAADKLKAEQAKLAQQTEAQKAEQARLARQAAELKAQQARLDARAAELAAEEKRLAQLRIDQEAEAARLANLTRQRDEAAREAALRSERETQTADLSRDTDAAETGPTASNEIPPLRTTPAPSRSTFARLDFGAARRSCTRAAEDEALARNFYSAEYDSAPRFVQGDAWEVRGRMRLEDRRGYLIVDTICEVDANGEARDFIFLR